MSTKKARRLESQLVPTLSSKLRRTTRFKKGNKIVIEKVRDLNSLSGEKMDVPENKLKEQDNTEKHEVNTGRMDEQMEN